MTTTTNITLDSILMAAERMWREYRRIHPPDGYDGDDYEVCDRICEEIIPQDKDALLALAADDRVWNANTGSMHEGIANSITMHVRDCIYHAQNAIDDEMGGRG